MKLPEDTVGSFLMTFLRESASNVIDPESLGVLVVHVPVDSASATFSTPSAVV